MQNRLLLTSTSITHHHAVAEHAMKRGRSNHLRSELIWKECEKIPDCKVLKAVQWLISNEENRIDGWKQFAVKRD